MNCVRIVWFEAVQIFRYRAAIIVVVQQLCDSQINTDNSIRCVDVCAQVYGAHTHNHEYNNAHSCKWKQME